VLAMMESARFCTCSSDSDKYHGMFARSGDAYSNTDLTSIESSALLRDYYHIANRNSAFP